MSTEHEFIARCVVYKGRGQRNMIGKWLPISCVETLAKGRCLGKRRGCSIDMGNPELLKLRDHTGQAVEAWSIEKNPNHHKEAK